MRVDGDRRLGGDDLPLPERADAAVGTDGRAVRTVETRVGRREAMASATRVGAEPCITAQARDAGAARRRPGKDHEVANAQARYAQRRRLRPLGHARAERLDHGRALMTEDDIGRPRPLAVDHVQVGVAHA